MIPLVDLKAQYRAIKVEIDAAIARVLDSGQFVLGDEVRAFEEEFASFCGVRYGIAVNSGTSALHLALLAAGVGPGDEVVTVPFTFVATVAAIRYTGARPVFVDIDPSSYLMDVRLLEEAITPRTKAIIPVHLYGQPADMESIMAIARRRGVVVIEDAAQAHGAEYRGRRAGSIGDLGCFSFYPGKNLGAYGEGGFLATDNPGYARTLRMLRDWGQSRRYHHVVQGFNYRMDALQGAILRVKLRHLERWTEARRAHARTYRALLGNAAVQPPVELPDRRHVYHVYAIRTARRDVLQQALHARGIATGIHYPIPVHLQRAHRDLGYGPRDFRCATEAAGQVLSLPMFPELAPEDVDLIARVIRDAEPLPRERGDLAARGRQDPPSQRRRLPGTSIAARA